MTEVVAWGALAVAAIAAWLAWTQRERLSQQEDAHAALANELRADLASVGREANGLRKRLAEIEEDRRADELAPRLEGEFRRKRPMPPHIVLRNEDARRIDQLDITVVYPPGLPSIIKHLVLNDAETVDAGSVGPIEPGAEAHIVVTEDTNGRGGSIRLRCDAHYGTRRGSTIVTVDVPGYARVVRAR